ncbi:secreted containing Dystroglycan-type cadherin-like domain [Brachionus plicatilis]|uniref:Secreted containing Dystroglycan-type cadherin-like domain n=1 Tax=Brachionus plicatilis TaxID=10195 RepID=A0A3M7RGQ5_BRAPC|nr:secreted containing Dystroglycan-type cadherin-like domain [Brachionus plicatilis]
MQDLVRSNHLYEPYNMWFSQDRYGNSDSALSFTNGYIKGPDDAYFKNEFTVLAWVKLRKYNEWQRLFDLGKGDNNIYATLSDPENRVAFHIFNRNLNEVTSSEALTLDEWHHVGFTLKEGIIPLTINFNQSCSSSRYFSSLSTKKSSQYLCLAFKILFKKEIQIKNSKLLTKLKIDFINGLRKCLTFQSPKAQFYNEKKDDSFVLKSFIFVCCIFLIVGDTYILLHPTFDIILHQCLSLLGPSPGFKILNTEEEIYAKIATKF